MALNLNNRRTPMVPDHKLRSIASDVRAQVIGAQSSASMCLVVSSPLAERLRAVGIACRLVAGGVRSEHHYWIELSDGRIVDATADQFPNPSGDPMPPVFVGTRPTWYGPTPIRAAITRRQMLLAATPP